MGHLSDKWLERGIKDFGIKALVQSIKGVCAALVIYVWSTTRCSQWEQTPKDLAMKNLQLTNWSMSRSLSAVCQSHKPPTHKRRLSLEALSLYSPSQPAARRFYHFCLFCVAAFIWWKIWILLPWNAIYTSLADFFLSFYCLDILWTLISSWCAHKPQPPVWL